jgi:hypothetical protein
MDDGFYSGPSSNPVTRPLGTEVELFNANFVSDSTAHFTSTSVPAGGVSFDSGISKYGGTFHFLPNVEGTWSYMDLVGGVSGRVIVSGPVPGGWCP